MPVAVKDDPAETLKRWIFQKGLSADANVIFTVQIY